MLNRFIILLLLLCFAGLSFAQVSAPPRDQTQAAVLADMSRRTGENVTINSLASQQWYYGTYDYVRNLGCAAAPASAPASGNWQRFVFNYRGLDYIYMVSDNLQSLILCNEPTLPTAIPATATPSPTQQGTGQSGGGIVQATSTVSNLQPTATLQGLGQTGGGFGNAGDNPVIDAICLLPPRLAVNEYGRVTPGDSNWVHEQPSRDSTKTGEIPAGAQFYILRGPICDTATGMNYWEIEYNGSRGWTSEGLDSEYWLEPVANVFRDDTVDEAFVPEWANAIAVDSRLALSPNNTMIAFEANSQRLDLLSLADNSLIMSIDLEAELTLLDFLSEMVLVLGFANGELQLIQIDSLPENDPVIYQHEGAVTALTVNAFLIVVADDAGILSFWKPGMIDNPLRRIQLPETAGRLEFSLDNRLLLVWDTNDEFIAALQIP